MNQRIIRPICAFSIVLILATAAQTAGAVGYPDANIILLEPDDRGPAIETAAFFPDGSRLLTAETDRSHEKWAIRVRDETNGHELFHLTDRAGYASGMVTCAVCSPDGALIVGGFEGSGTESPSRTIRVWTSSSGEEVSQPVDACDWITSLCFSTDGSFLISTDLRRFVRIWEVDSWKEIGAVPASPDTKSEVQAVVASEGNRIITASIDGAVRIWEFES